MKLSNLSEFEWQVRIAAFRILLNYAVQALKGTPDDCDETFFNTTTFRQFHVQLFKLLSPQLSDQSDSDSIVNTLLLHHKNQNHSLDTFQEVN